jgi:scyllo-inositol 2-dehydrogenase (NADP+)
VAHKLAIVGYGGMGNWHHKNIKEHIPDIEVVCAFDIREELREIAEKNGIKFYSSLDEILGDSSIEIVTVATPNNFHKDIAIACLKSGKNVICEKPVAMNSEELKEIIEVSKNTGKLFSIHQNRRWDKDYQTIRKIIKDDIIGKPYFIESKVQGSRRMLHGWRGYKENGGGMVYDWGVHLIDQLLDLIPSPVVSVNAHLVQIFSEEVDDNFKTMIKFENGVSALVEIATNCFITQPRWHICCSEGTAVVENWDAKGKMVRLATDEKMKWDNDIVYTAAGPTRTMAPRPVHTVTEVELPKVQTNWSDYYKNIVDVIDNKAELIVKPGQALRVMKIIDAVFQSGREGISIKCNI